MKIMITFFSILIIFAGLIPFFGDKFPIPNKGAAYSVVLLIFSVLMIVLSFVNRLLFGIERFVIIIQGLLLIGVSILPYFPALFTFIPRDGFLHSLVIIIIGAIGLVYGLMGMG
jgi:hypothetical protein